VKEIFMSLTFEPINFDLQENYLKRLVFCPVKTSDYSFINLWGWAQEYGLFWAWEEELVWIKQTKPQTVFWPPVGNWVDIDWNNSLLNFNQEKIQFIRVPELLLKIWKKQLDDVIFEDDRDQWDYLYSIIDLIDLKGNRFHKKKNLLNQFLKKYDYKYICFGKEMIDHVLAMQSEWCQWKDCELNEALAAENRVIENVLNAWNKFERISGGAIFTDEKIVAYTLAEILSDDILLIHFEKGNPSYQGAYQAINQMFVSQLSQQAKHTLKLVNRMQDLGDKGLRKAKLSYQPVDFIHKFKVTLST
jgi:uncharacterized protein